jgi:catechol-2,3-dioxygenase
LAAVLNCASFRRSNRRRRHIVVNIWSTRGQLEKRRTRNHS